MPDPIIGIGEILWDLLPAGPRAGGAPFNFTFHCHQLGQPAVIVSRVGDDKFGHQLRAEVRRLGLTDEYIQIDPDHPTGTVEVELNPHGVPSYRIVEEVAYDYLEWNEPLQRLAEQARAVCFGTLGQRQVVSRNTIRRFVDAAKVASSCTIVYDINLRPPYDDPALVKDSLQHCDWLKLNLDEWNILQYQVLFAPEWQALREKQTLSPELLVGEFLKRCGLALICITLGAEGAYVTTRDAEVKVPGVAVQATDTVGAGDAFTAGLLTQTLAGRSLAEAARFANGYAALVATRPGGTPLIDRAEVERLC